MDYEKAYKEALNRAKGAHNSAKSDKENGVTDICTKYTIQLTETIFPELKESEDERIRKNLREFLLDAPAQDIVSHHLDLEETLNWLEKQGEQKPVEWNTYDKATLEYIIEDIKELCDNETEEGSIETYNREINLLQAINKSIKLSSYTNPAAWSEEDEKMIESICRSINHESVCEGLRKAGISYSLRTSVDLLNNQLSWLKSLKERYTWKPSDEQMETIEHICDGNFNVNLDILDSIYRDFKKLRKE